MEGWKSGEDWRQQAHPPRGSPTLAPFQGSSCPQCPLPLWNPQMGLDGVDSPVHLPDPRSKMVSSPKVWETCFCTLITDAELWFYTLELGSSPVRRQHTKLRTSLNLIHLNHQMHEPLLLWWVFSVTWTSLLEFCILWCLNIFKWFIIL